MTTLREGQVLQERGVWQRRFILVGAATEPRMESAHVSCPSCGKAASLRDHQIAADGTVTPSLVCPTAGCDFHDHVTLDGWSRREPATGGGAA